MFSTRFGAKLPNLKTTNISGYMVYMYYKYYEECLATQDEDEM